MTKTYIRTTHIDGVFRETKSEEPISDDANFIVHLLHPEHSMSISDIVASAKMYDEQNPDTKEASWTDERMEKVVEELVSIGYAGVA